MTVLEIVLVCVLAAIVCCALSVWLFKKDTESEDRKRGAIKLASTLESVGLKRIPKFLVDYAVNDFSGMAKAVADLVRMFADGGEEAVMSEFGAVFDSLLTAKLHTEAGRALVAAKLEEAVKVDDVAAIVEAPKAGVV
jgi:hypothetical protein